MEKEKSVNGYSLSMDWFNFAFENQEKLNPGHTAMYLWFIELNNRMGWATNFSSPASQTMAAIGIKSYNTYKKIFDELVGFGVVQLVMKSENQYKACVIALSNFDKSPNKSLEKSLLNHLTNQSEITYSINKPKNKQTKKEKQVSEVGATSDVDDFILYFNSKANRRFKKSDKLSSTLEARLKSYSLEDIKIAIENAHKDTHHIETQFKFLTPEFILRQEKLERFLNQSEVAITNGNPLKASAPKSLDKYFSNKNE